LKAPPEAYLKRDIAGVEEAPPLPGPRASVRELRAYEDALDAVICARVAACALERRAVPFGDETAAIWIPQAPPIYSKK
jgi:hypothetical protein